MDQKELLAQAPETMKYLQSIFLESDIDNVLSYFRDIVSKVKLQEAVFEFPVVFNTPVLIRTFSSYVTALNNFERPLTVLPNCRCVYIWAKEHPVYHLNTLVFKMQEPIQNDSNSQLIVLEIPTFKKLLTA